MSAHSPAQLLLPSFDKVPTDTEAEVCADIARRQAHGLAKYGTSVRDNPLTLRQWLQHAYEEHLDAAVYLKRAMEELDKGASTCAGCPAPCRKADACLMAPDGRDC